MDYSSNNELNTIAYFKDREKNRYFKDLIIILIGISLFVEIFTVIKKKFKDLPF